MVVIVHSIYYVFTILGSAFWFYSDVFMSMYEKNVLVCLSPTKKDTLNFVSS